MSKDNGRDDEWENLGENFRSYIMSQEFREPGQTETDEEPLRPRDPRDSNHFRDVWDKVATSKDTAHIISFLNGQPYGDTAPTLEKVVRAFFDASRTAAIWPEQISDVIIICGGVLSARTATLRPDVCRLWGEMHDAWIASVKREAEAPKWLAITDVPWDPDKLPPRPWLATPYLMREEITLLHGPGAAGKSQLCVAWAVALALGKSFGRLRPRQRSRVLLTNFEDNAVEQQRRISAMLRSFDATPADLQGWLYRVSLGSESDATMFNLDEFGQVEGTPCWDALKDACKSIKPDAVFADPLVAINAVPENNNQLMRRVMSVISFDMAKHYKVALVLAHHDNKSGSEDEDSDASNARGGTDIVNAVRFEIQTKKMTVGQADGWGIDPKKRGFYFRAGSAASKRNYTAPEESEWFERLEAVVGGEPVVFCVPYAPPTSVLTEAQTTSLVATIEKATEHGPYSPQLGKTDRSLAPAFERLGIVPKNQTRALKALLETGLVEKAEWEVRDGRWRAGLRSKAGLPYNYKWQEAQE